MHDYPKGNKVRTEQGKTVQNTRNIVDRKYIRYKDGAKVYGIGLTKFQALAHEAHAVCKIDGIVLVDCSIMDKFIDSFREY